MSGDTTPDRPVRCCSSPARLTPSQLEPALHMLLAGWLACLRVDASQIALLLMGRLAPIGINCLAMLLPGLQASQNEDVSATASVCVCPRVTLPRLTCCAMYRIALQVRLAGLQAYTATLKSKYSEDDCASDFSASLPLALDVAMTVRQQHGALRQPTRTLLTRSCCRLDDHATRWRSSHSTIQSLKCSWTRCQLL